MLLRLGLAWERSDLAAVDFADLATTAGVAPQGMMEQADDSSSPADRESRLSAGDSVSKEPRLVLNGMRPLEESAGIGWRSHVSSSPLGLQSLRRGNGRPNCSTGFRGGSGGVESPSGRRLRSTTGDSELRRPVDRGPHGGNVAFGRWESIDRFL